MKTYRYKLHVADGPDTDGLVEFSSSASVGRDAGNDLRLTDPALAGRHFALVPDGDSVRVEIADGQSPAVMARGSTMRAVLKDGESFSIGKSRFQVYVIEDETVERDRAEQVGKARRLRIVVAIVFVAVAGGLGAIAVFQRRQAEANAPPPPVEFGKFYRHEGDALPQRFELWFPAREAVFPPPTNDLVRGVFKFDPKAIGELKTEDLLPGGKATWPLDPMLGESSRRDWSKFRPRLGSWRFLPGNRMVLGDYAFAKLHYKCEDETVPGERGDQPLEIQFFVETWDGLPPVEIADAGKIGLTAPSADPWLLAAGVERFPLLPRRFSIFLPREERLDVGESDRQSVATMDKARGVTYRQDLIRAGDVAVIMTSKYWTYQEPFVADAVDALVAAQRFRSVPAPGGERLRSEAVALEAEADRQMLPFPRVQDVRTDDQIVQAIRAFNRYHKALVLLQTAGAWGLDEDFSRIFEKARAIHDELHAEGGRLESLRGTVEDFRMHRAELKPGTDRRRHEEVAEAFDALFRIATQAEEPNRFPPGDWFRYACELKRDEAEWLGRRK